MVQLEHNPPETCASFLLPVFSHWGGRAQNQEKEREGAGREEAKNIDIKFMEFVFSSTLSGISAAFCVPCEQVTACRARTLPFYLLAFSLIFKYANTSEERFKLLTMHRSEGPLSS